MSCGPSPFPFNITFKKLILNQIYFSWWISKDKVNKKKTNFKFWKSFLKVLKNNDLSYISNNEDSDKIMMA